MSKRERIVRFGAAAVLVLAGALCAVLVSGTLGQVLAFVLIALGLVGATSLVFFEVGLSEDRERAREEAAAAAAARAAGLRRVRPRSRKPLARLRGERRRLDR